MTRTKRQLLADEADEHSSARAMAYEAKQELGYPVDKWMCYRYLEEALPEDHPDHDPEATA